MGSLHDLGEARLRKQHELWQRAELAMDARMAARLAQVVVADASEFVAHVPRSTTRRLTRSPADRTAPSH